MQLFANSAPIRGVSTIRRMSRAELEISDERLLRQYREGREGAFASLFRRYSRRIHGYVVGIVGDADLADDVTQQVFVKLSRRPEAYAPGTSFSSWLYRVARNAAFDALKRRRNPVPLDELEGEVGAGRGATAVDSPSVETAEGIHDRDINLLVHRAVQKLEGAQREALILREYSELSYREIAEITGRSLTNVKQDIYQARQFLRAELAPHLGRTGSR